MSRFRPYILLALTGTLLFAGCRDFALDSNGGDASSLEGDGVATLSVPFELNFGQRVILDAIDFTVEFTMVTEDNRCADQVDCVQAGRAGVLLSVTDAQSVRYQLVAYIPGLVATPYEYNDIIQFQGYRFRLLQVDPYPVSGVDRKMDSYKVLLIVEPLDANLP